MENCLVHQIGLILKWLLLGIIFSLKRAKRVEDIPIFKEIECSMNFGPKFLGHVTWTRLVIGLVIEGPLKVGTQNLSFFSNGFLDNIWAFGMVCLLSCSKSYFYVFAHFYGKRQFYAHRIRKSFVAAAAKKLQTQSVLKKSLSSSFLLFYYYRRWR